MNKYDGLKIKNQLCFPLYAVSNKIIRNYKPILNSLDLTYTQYIAMMVLWEKENISEKELGKALFLKSNTLTPLLKKLTEKKYVKIVKNNLDGRNIVISLTESGKKLKDKAVVVPKTIAETINLTKDETEFLYKILYKILDSQN